MAVAYGLISSGFSASTGLKIQSPIPDDPTVRRCSGCGLEADNCPRHRWRGGVQWIDDTLFGGWWFGGNAERVQEYFPCPRRETFNEARLGYVGESAQGARAPQTAAPNIIQLGIKDLFSMTCMMYSPPAAVTAEGTQGTVRVTICLLKFTGRNRLTVDVNSNMTIRDLRQKVADNLGLPRRELMLIFNGNQLDDHEEIRYLGISSGCKIIAMKCKPGEQMGIFQLDPSELDCEYDYDFTDRTDDGNTYKRGGHNYQRPYGWKRYAVKVRGEYDDDTWLGENGIRTRSTPGEWAVSYHGTEKPNVKPIIDDGYKIGPRGRFGQAIYSSPSLVKIDEYGYTKSFTEDGKTYKFALQNRVDPNHLTVIPPDQTGIEDFPYWLSPTTDPDTGRDVRYVRPYGVLTQEI